MSYILKNTSALINSRLTDTGREKLSQGNFNISYFQIGDSEVSYNVLSPSYNQSNTMILEPAFNAQNSSGSPQSNKQNIKYPYYVDGFTGNTYGIPYMDSIASPVYNRAEPRGFFTGVTTDDFTYWSAFTDNKHVINSNYIIDMSTLNGSNVVNVVYSGCNTTIARLPQAGDLITIYYDGRAKYDCNCGVPTPSPTPTITTTTTNTVTPTPTETLPCTTPEPTPTPTFPTPTPLPVETTCVMSMYSCYGILTYRIIDVCNNEITLDRPTPDYSDLLSSCYARTVIYPPNMVNLYDSITPLNHYSDSVIGFESLCNVDEIDVKVWNMNIPWSEDLAGLDDNVVKGFSNFGSVQYMGTKEYLGYQSTSGQTFYIDNTFSAETTDTYYYNSFGGLVKVQPEEQKAIAIIHYTNQTIDFYYGEKFALESIVPSLPDDTVGNARNFKISIPTLMWHKNPDCCQGQSFWVDPPGFDEDLNLFQPSYIESKKNLDMNLPGIRYYHLWDNIPNVNGLPSRIGKVFPDHKIVIIDDEEIIAALSYKSNRNWTLPAPKIALTTPNTCGSISQSSEGILTGNTEYLYVTYRLGNDMSFTNSLHCNYYTKIQGPNLSCSDIGSQNVSVRFGGEFNCLNYKPYNPSTTTTTTTFYTTTTTTICPDTCSLPTGFFADKFEIICQKVIGNGRPDPTEWKAIDYTDLLSTTTINGNISADGLTGTTFVITKDLYDAAPTYDLSDYINLTPKSFSGQQLNFGDEYYFYGNVETDIQATIYEMRYKINLGAAEFQASSNPGWVNGKPLYITEIGLYDSNDDLMIISKLQTPTPRQGIQQFVIKFDF